MQKAKLSLIGVLGTLLIMFCAVSCSEDQDPIEMPEEISETVKNQFTELGFDVSDIRMSQSSEVLDPSYEAGNYVLENDIIITPANLEKMLKSKIEHLGAVGEQYRTTNLVSSPTTINVIGYTGGSYALDNTMRTALQWSIDNYNALNTGLTFTLTFTSYFYS